MLGTWPAEFAEALGGRTSDVRRRIAASRRAEHRLDLWRERVAQINWELFDRGTEAFTWYALEEIGQGRRACRADCRTRRTATELERFAAAGDRRRNSAETSTATRFEPFMALRDELEKPFRDRVFLWPRRTGPRATWSTTKWGACLQVPGWSNILTQPIINRIDMLSTGVRTDIGVKVFGHDLDTIDRVCKDDRGGAQADPRRPRRRSPRRSWAKATWKSTSTARQAARYGITVEDIQNEIEVALAGRAVTYTVEKRERFPVRIRYARAEREDEESIRRLLVSPGSMAASAAARWQSTESATVQLRRRSRHDRRAVHGRPVARRHAGPRGRRQAADPAGRAGRRADRRRPGDDQERKRPAC